MKILIELPTWLGDTVMVTPAIENIVNHYNDSEITLIGSYISVEVLKNHPKVVKTLVLEKKYISMYKVSKNLGNFLYSIGIPNSDILIIFKDNK